jgi:hypothetical protein
MIAELDNEAKLEAKRVGANGPNDAQAVLDHIIQQLGATKEGQRYLAHISGEVTWIDNNHLIPNMY